MGNWRATFAPTITITPCAWESIGTSYLGNTAWASAVWPSANRALFIPFRIYQPITAVKMFTVNGAAASGNIDIGIYNADGTKLVSSGSTAMSGTSAMQVFDITDTQFGPGLFYLALAVDNVTAAFIRRGTSGTITNRFAGLLHQASAFPLPATATFASYSAAYIPLFGLTTRTVI